MARAPPPEKQEGPGGRHAPPVYARPCTVWFGLIIFSFPPTTRPKAGFFRFMVVMRSTHGPKSHPSPVLDHFLIDFTSQLLSPKPN